MANEVRIRTSVKDEASKPINDLKGAFEALKGPAGTAGVVMGVSAAAAASAFGLVDEAVSKTVDFLGESVKAAIDEQASTEKMNAALKANVAGWDGNTAAIENRINAGMRLGFTDDDLRDSFTKLVAATHDVNKAFDVQHVAMDLARLKGISLADASDALVKVEGGQYRALKSLGIVLKDGATQTEALAAVEKVAAGQAAAYADTIAGKTDQLNARFQALQQRIGGAVIPTLDRFTGGLVDLADATDGGTDSAGKFERGVLQLDAAITGVIMPGSALTKGFQQLADGIDRMDRVAAEAQGVIDKNIAALNDWRDAQMRAKAAFQDGDKRDAVANFQAIAAAEQHAADVAAMFAKTTRDTTKTVKDKWAELEAAAQTLESDLSTAGKNAASALYDPLIEKAKLAQDKQALAKLEDLRGTKKWTLDTQQQYLQLQSTILQEEADLAGYGKLSKSELSKLITQLQTQSQKATGATKAYIDELIQKLLALRGTANNAASALDNLQLNTGKGTGHKKLAAGGPIAPYGEAIVGDGAGPEVLRMGAIGGTVNPSASTAGGGGGGLTVNVSTPVMTPGSAQALADLLAPIVTRWQQQRGL